MSLRRSFRTKLGGGVALAALLLLTLPLAGQTATKDTQAAIVPIRGVINDVLRRSIERRIDEARAEGAKTIIFEMDTPGGLVTSSLDICTLIKQLPEEGINTVAWVHTEAYSAGAMISLACQQILMSSRSKIGDCAPIMITPVGGLQELGKAERAKAESPVLEEFQDSAVRNGYDPLLCRAMVTVGSEVWWVEHAGSAERKFISGDEKKKLIDDVGEGAESPWQLVTHYDDPITGKREVLKTQPIDSAEELLTLSQSQAVAYGLARSIAGSLEVVAETLELAEVPSTISISGWEKFAIWLNSPLVRGVLFVVMLVGAYIEFQSPGLILPGVTALIALGIFLGAPYAAGLADIWTIVLLVGGLALLGVEIFVIPGFGVAGILGVILILVAFLGTFVPSEPNLPTFSLPSMEGTWDALKTGVIVLSSSLIIAVMGIILLARYLPELPGVRRLMLANPRSEDLALRDPHSDLALAGDVGLVVSDLRPGGQARFGAEVIDVQSQGEFVLAGRKVQVLKRDGPNIVVRPLADDA